MRWSVLLLTAVLLLAGCGDGGGGEDGPAAAEPTGSPTSEAAERALAEQISQEFDLVPLGELVPVAGYDAAAGEEPEPERQLRGTVTALDVGEDSSGLWLEASVWVENPSREDIGFPTVTLACAGTLATGATATGSRTTVGQPVPSRTFVEGEQRLVVPDRACEAPAFVRFGRDEGSQWQVPADVLERLDDALAGGRVQPVQAG